MTYTDPPSLSLHTIRLDAFTHSGLLGLIRHAAATRSRVAIWHHNLHSLYLYHRREAFRQSYGHATHVYVDGMPVIWLAHAAGLPLKPKHRITLLDSLTLILEEAAISRWRVFYLGGQESVLVKGLRQLRTQHPGLIIDGHNGFFRSNGTQNDQVVSVINDFAPDILFVGMGMPLQELWLANNHSKLAVPVTLTCGATLEYITGDSYRPPTWAGPLGLYGIFRLLSDPRRLWHRYLYEPLALLPVMASAVIRQRLATLRR